MNNNHKAKYRIKFTKGGRLRFIGHLDLLNLFHRAIKRSKLPVSYSQGFNPHQETSFALPLSLGYYGNSEYIDIYFIQTINNSEIIEKLNKTLPAGISILSARPFAEGEKNAASLTAAAEYSVILPENSGITQGQLNDFLEQAEILVEKKTKKSSTQINIKPDILKLSSKCENENIKEINMLISAGSQRSIRADSVMKSLYSFSGLPYDTYGISYIRENLYKSENGSYITLE